VHVISVCQPTVPVLAAISLMATNNDPKLPKTMTMMGGPIDPRKLADAGQRPGHRKAVLVV
jgi:poly(3-hydroxybutyrate) depolymerase